MKNKKGIMGFDTAKAVIVALLILGVFAIVFMLTMNTMDTALNLSPSSGSVVNESGYINESGYTLVKSTLDGFILSTVSAINGSDNTTITSGNWTITNGVVTNATETVYDDAKITYTYIYDSDNQNNVDSIVGNSSSGLTTFFSYMPTIFTLLGVVMIILVIAIVIVAVTRFQPGVKSEGSEL